MNDHRGSKLLLLAATLLLVVGAASSEVASAASPSKLCINESCKLPKKGCISNFKNQFTAAKVTCTGAKTNTVCEKVDKECKKAAKDAFKLCKQEASEIFKLSKQACSNGFITCKTCCQNEQTQCSIVNCADGVRVEGEECDDGNLTNGDGCEADCTATPPSTTTTSSTTVASSTSTTTTATAPVSTTTQPPTTSTTTTTTAPVSTTTLPGCNPTCCDKDFLSFETGIPAPGATAGTLRNFRCSNAAAKACVVNSDCTPPGTCNEQTTGGLPLALKKGGLYTGAGLNSVPLPFPVPDQGLSYTTVTDCNADSGVLTLAESAPADLVGVVAGCTTGAENECHRHCTKGRTCSNNPAQHCAVNADCGAGTCLDNCLYGPPLPIPNANNAPTSVCAVNVIDLDATGTAQCNGGATDVSTPLRSIIYLNGDLLSATSPPDVPGIQPCPLCSAQCVGGANATLPCQDNADCPGSTCDGTPNCIAGPNNGAACTPETSDSAALGDTQNSYPTSQDCAGGQPGQNITTNIGGIPIDFGLTSGSLTLNIVNQPTQNRVFCGYCRDRNSTGSLCFEGDPDPGSIRGCPVPGNGTANDCETEADCSAPYEACEQRNSGGFSKAGATRIEAAGETDGQCLGDGNPHPGTLVSIFCVPPTFDPTVDGAGDLPGPGAALIVGEAQMQ